MKTYTYSYQNGLCLGASADAGEFGRGRQGRQPSLPGTRPNFPASAEAVRRRPGMSHAEAAGSKVRLACRMPRPLGQK